MNSHRGHRGHNHFSVFSAPSVANSLHKFENWYKVCPTLLSLLVRGRFEREDDVIAAFTIFFNVDRGEVFDGFHATLFALRSGWRGEAARRGAAGVRVVNRAVERNPGGPALGGGLPPGSARGFLYGLGLLSPLPARGEKKPLEPRPPL